MRFIFYTFTMNNCIWLSLFIAISLRTFMHQVMTTRFTFRLNNINRILNPWPQKRHMCYWTIISAKMMKSNNTHWHLTNRLLSGQVYARRALFKKLKSLQLRHSSSKGRAEASLETHCLLKWQLVRGLHPNTPSHWISVWNTHTVALAQRSITFVSLNMCEFIHVVW